MPFLARTSEPEEAPSIDGKEIVRNPLEGEARPPKPAAQVLHEELRASETWGFSPVVSDQEHVYPDTVKIIETHVSVLDLSDAPMAAKMAEILRSDKQRGRYTLVQSIRVEFSEVKGTFLALVMYYERQFKQFETK